MLHRIWVTMLGMIRPVLVVSLLAVSCPAVAQVKIFELGALRSDVHTEFGPAGKVLRADAKQVSLMEFKNTDLLLEYGRELTTCSCANHQPMRMKFMLCTTPTAGSRDCGRKDAWV